MTDLPEILRGILERRGIGAAELEGYFNPSLADLAKPEELPGICEAAEEILDAVLYRRKIVIFGDYDCDGICATAIMISCLAALGAKDNVTPFLPNRLNEGYGMSDASVARMLKENPGVGLVVTVDNGINAIPQIASLRERWVPVVVTDHHLASRKEDGTPDLPAAKAVVDPKVAAPESMSNLCGAGVAFMLANRIMSEAKRRGMYKGPSIGGPLLILAGLASVTDIMPLVGQNRILVAEALHRFGACAPLGLRELLERASKTTPTTMTSKDFSFLLGPRINAAGRIADGMEALELILADDREIAREAARIVDLRNIERKNIERRMTEEALAKVVPGALAQVIDLSDGHPGIAGIVAARLLERLGNVPVCVVAGGHGSARAPDGVNIRDAFEACSDMLTRFGGHAAAGGFSVKEGRMDDFRRALNDYCRTLECVSADKPAPTEPDAWVTLADITVELAEWVVRMEPFGEGNPMPRFGFRDAAIVDARTLGQEGNHLTLTIGTYGAPRTAPRLRAIWWGHGELAEQLRSESGMVRDIQFTIELSEYGTRHVELRIVSLGEPHPPVAAQ